MQFLDPIGLRDGASKAREQMHVVFHAADEKGGHLKVLAERPGGALWTDATAKALLRWRKRTSLVL